MLNLRACCLYVWVVLLCFILSFLELHPKAEEGLILFLKCIRGGACCLHVWVVLFCFHKFHKLPAPSVQPLCDNVLFFLFFFCPASSTPRRGTRRRTSRTPTCSGTSSRSARRLPTRYIHIVYISHVRRCVSSFTPRSRARQQSNHAHNGNR